MSILDQDVDQGEDLDNQQDMDIDLSDTVVIEPTQTTLADIADEVLASPANQVQHLAKSMQEAMPKTMSNTCQNSCKDNVKDVVIFGGDLFKLLSKASSESEGWMKSTKAMETPTGVVIQVTTQQHNDDGSYAVAEALTFVPGVCIRGEGDKRILAQLRG
jgi:hypothetical protein